MAIAGSLEIQLFANLARIRQDMDQARQIVGTTMQSIERAVGIAKQALATLGLSFGVAGVISLVDQYSKYNAQLKLVTESTRELAAAQEDVRRITTLAQSDLAATGVLFARITNATRELGTSQREVSVLTEVVSLALKVSGATAQESSSAMLQLSQAFASGKFRGEEFNAVNEAAPRLMKALADGMGVPIGALREMASNGLITADVMTKALPHALKELRTEALEVQTIGGAFTVLKNAVMEFIGAQAIGNNGVATISQSLVVLARNLDLVAGVISGITVSKLAGWLATTAQAFYAKATAAIASVQASQAERVANIGVLQTEIARTASTLEFVVAERARMAAEIAAAQATLAATAAVGAQSYALRLNAEAAVANTAAFSTMAQLGRLHAAALQEQAVAQAALTAAQAASGTAATLAARLLTALGGPIGIITTLLGLGVTAWALWGRSSEDANKKAATSTVASTNEIIVSLDKQIVKLQERLDLARKFGDVAKRDSPESDRAAGLSAQIDALLEKQAAARARGSRLDRQDQYSLDQANQDLAELLFKMGKLHKIKTDLEAVGQQPKMAEWMAKYATDAEKLALKLAEARKDFGGSIPPEIDTRIRAHFAESANKKAAEEAKRLRDLDTKGWVEKIENDEREFEAMLHQIAKDTAEFYKAKDKMADEDSKAMFEGIDAQIKEFEDNLTRIGKLQPSRTEQSEKSLKELNKYLDPSNAKRFGTVLSDSFGLAGRALGDLIDKMQVYANTMEDIERARTLTRDIDDPVKRKELELALDKKATQERLGFYGDMASAASGFFNTQSKGYQTLQRVSQVFHAAELALTMAELVPKAISAVLSQGQGDPYSAFARMAAMTALVAGLGVAIGGGGGGAANLAADRQKSSGTGSVLGDAAAKSDSITKAMDLLAKNSIIGNEHTRAMLRSLQSIDNNMAGLAALVARNLGLTGADTAGLGIGTTAGSGAYALGVKAIGATAGAIIGAQIGLMMGPITGLIGAAIGAVLGAIGAIKTKVTLSDSGLQINPQTVGQARHGLSASSYQDVTTQNSYLWGLFKGKESTQRIMGDVGAEITAQFTLIINGIYDSIVGAAKIFGMDIESVKSMLDAFDIDLTSVSFKDLSGDEIEKQLLAIFSKIGDDMAGVAFPGIEKFQKVGEGLFETLGRLAQEFVATDEIARILGKDVSTAFGAVGFASMEARDHLVQLFGGIEELSDGVSKYYELFYSEAERTDRTIAMLEQQFGEFNLALPLTMDEFRKLVEAQDLSTESGRNMFAFLMQVAPAFDSIASAAKSMADDIYSAALTIGGGLSSSAKQIAMQNAAKAWNDYYNNYAGTTIDVATTIANATLASTQAAGGDRTLLDSMISGAMSIGGTSAVQLLQNLFRAIAANTEATGSNTQTVDNSASSFAQAMQQMADARATLAQQLEGLLTSPSSPLAITEQYNVAKQTFYSHLALAQAGNNPGEVAGISKYFEEFVRLSQMLNGSNGAYNVDWYGGFNAMAGLTGGLVEPYTNQTAREINALQLEALSQVREEVRQSKLATISLGQFLAEFGLEVRSPDLEEAIADSKPALSGGGFLQSSRSPGLA